MKLLTAKDIKPCPFCGGDAVMVKTQKYGRYVECLSCGTRTEEFETEYLGSAYGKAVHAWNKIDVKGDQNESHNESDQRA